MRSTWSAMSAKVWALLTRMSVCDQYATSLPGRAASSRVSLDARVCARTQFHGHFPDHVPVVGVVPRYARPFHADSVVRLEPVRSRSPSAAVERLGDVRLLRQPSRFHGVLAIAPRGIHDHNRPEERFGAQRVGGLHRAQQVFQHAKVVPHREEQGVGLAHPAGRLARELRVVVYCRAERGPRARKRLVDPYGVGGVDALGEL
jgi:hypothetical protein